MMGRGKWRWLRAAACCLFFLLLSLARSASLGLEGQELDSLRTMALSFPLTGQDGAAIRETELLEEHPVSFVLWGQQAGRSAMNPDLGRYASCDIIAAWGGSRLLYASTAPLASDDPDGCLLDRATAMALFGSYAPVGCQVALNGQEFTIRGILETGQQVAVITAQDGPLDRLTFRIPEGDPPQRTSEDFARRHGLYGDLHVPGAWAGIARAVSLLPVAVLMLGVIGGHIRAAFPPGTSRLRFWAGIALAGAMWFMLLWLTEFSFQLPDEMIPNRWSDFDFWAQLLETKKAEMLHYLSQEKPAPELALLLPVFRAGIFGVLASLLVPLLPRPRTAKGLWLCCAGAALLAFAASVLLDPCLAHDRALWLALPAAFTGRWLGQPPSGPYKRT